MEDSRPPSSQAEKLDEKLDDDQRDPDLGEASNNIASQAVPEQSGDSQYDDKDIEHSAGLHSHNNEDGNENDEGESEKERFLVKWDEGEKQNPRNFSVRRKAFITFQLGMLALAGSLGSSIISPAETHIARYVHVSQEVAVLCVALYVLGFAFGPSLWAPISETYGRKVSMLPPVFILGLFSIGTGFSTNAAGIFLTRFFGGLFASAPISNVSAALGDMYEPKARGIAVTFYAVCVVGGPTLGPVIGSAITVHHHLSWRWTEFVEAIWAMSVFTLALIFMPEVYPPVLLKRKAQRLRKSTGDDRYWHPHEAVKMTLKNIVTKHLSRPGLMLLTEPMVTCIALYASFVYGLLYLTLEVFPIVYREHRHFREVTSTLPFLGLFVGCLVAVCVPVPTKFSRNANASSSDVDQSREPTTIRKDCGSEQGTRSARSEAAAHVSRRLPVCNWIVLVTTSILLTSSSGLT